MPTKIVTMTQQDQDLLRVALTRAVEWEAVMKYHESVTEAEVATTERIKAMKERLL